MAVFNNQVAWLLLLDTLNTVFDIGFVFRYTITLFGKAYMADCCAELNGFIKAISGRSPILIGVSLAISILCRVSDRGLQFSMLVSYMPGLGPRTGALMHLWPRR
jgi:hypothetical protein